MQDQSGARVKIDPAADPNSDERTVNISGDPKCVAIAKQLVEDKVAEVREKKANKLTILFTILYRQVVAEVADMVDITMMVTVEEDIDHITKTMEMITINKEAIKEATKEDMIILSNTVNITLNMDTIKANIIAEKLVRNGLFDTAE